VKKAASLERMHSNRTSGSPKQDVFYALVETNRRLMPIDHVTG
jgi:hypothetical protein